MIVVAVVNEISTVEIHVAAIRMQVQGVAAGVIRGSTYH
jgi:hypothetical protein